MINITEFLDSVGGHPTSKQSEWLLTCWECGDPKLYFNIDKIIGFCVKCNKPRTMFDIARNLANISFKDIQEYIDNHKVQSFATGSFRDSMVNGLLSGQAIQESRELVKMGWPEGYRSLEEGKSSVIGRKATAYLLSRGFNLEQLYRLRFGYCATGVYEGRVIIPTTYDGVLVYWQARDFTGTVAPSAKILNPSTKTNPNGKSQVIFNYDAARLQSHVIVTESWGSCLACRVPGAVAVNGKHISERQLSLLENMGNETFTVLFDAGVGVPAAWTAAEALSKIKPTFVATLPWGDPNEVPKSVLYDSIRERVLYSKDAHIKYRIASIGKVSTQLQVE